MAELYCSEKVMMVLAEVQYFSSIFICDNQVFPFIMHRVYIFYVVFCLRPGSQWFVVGDILCVILRLELQYFPWSVLCMMPSDCLNRTVILRVMIAELSCDENSCALSNIMMMCFCLNNSTLFFFYVTVVCIWFRLHVLLTVSHLNR